MTRVRSRIALASLAAILTLGLLPKAVSTQGRLGGVGITVFVDTNFRGYNANFRSDVPDLRKFSLNDRIASMQVGRGEVWEVCEDINYHGRCQIFTGSESDLGRVSWGGNISSMRLIRDYQPPRGGYTPPPPIYRARLILFDDRDYRGKSVAVTDSAPNFGSYGNRAGSIQVYGGTWEVCDGDRFRGHCETIRESISDLGRIHMRDKISSARLVGR